MGRKRPSVTSCTVPLAYRLSTNKEPRTRTEALPPFTYKSDKLPVLCTERYAVRSLCHYTPFYCTMDRGGRYEPSRPSAIASESRDLTPRTSLHASLRSRDTHVAFDLLVESFAVHCKVKRSIERPAACPSTLSVVAFRLDKARPRGMPLTYRANSFGHLATFLTTLPLRKRREPHHQIVQNFLP